jgi:large subunit ribosomal protein L30
MAKTGKLKITLVRSTIGEKPKTRAAVRTLGLRKINQVTERPDNGSVRGLLDQVAHLVEVEET